jgi:hypothetical protein
MISLRYGGDMISLRYGGDMISLRYGGDMISLRYGSAFGCWWELARWRRHDNDVLTTGQRDTMKTQHAVSSVA